MRIVFGLTTSAVEIVWPPRSTMERIFEELRSWLPVLVKINGSSKKTSPYLGRCVNHWRGPPAYSGSCRTAVEIIASTEVATRWGAPPVCWSVSNENDEYCFA